MSKTNRSRPEASGFGILKIYITSIISLLIISCSKEKPIPLTEQQVAIKWADMTLYITHYTPSNSPTYASRCIGYIGLTMYESIVQGYDDYQSLEGQRNG